MRNLIAPIFPQYCVLCGLRSDRNLALCTRCEADLRFNGRHCYQCALPLNASGSLCGNCLRSEPAYERVVAPWIYDERLGHVIKRWKFQGDLRLTPLLISLWLQGRSSAGSVDLLLPVPLHWRRRWQRGFNQSELLCRQLQKYDPLLETTPVESRLLLRGKATAPQSGLTARQRAVNLRDAFTVCKPCDNLSIAVVDDVFTTGATADAVARALREAGARRVEIWCIARTPTPASGLNQCGCYY